jgi:Fe-only nitrogenase accessory protein AnfO
MIKIGVVLNNGNQITSLLEATKVEIYEQSGLEWSKTSEITKCFKTRNSMNEMREFLNELIAQLGDCKILVASILTGIPFMILDKEGFMLCEAEVFSRQLLEEIASDYTKMKQDIELAKEKGVNSANDYPTRPFETKVPGIFEFDMRKLQEIHPDISSKKALIPFLKEVKFYQLKVFCGHVMPWLDRELPILGFDYQVEKLEEQGYLVQIEKICCN